ncbi:hypothetical protein ACQP10_34165 [Streptosporangium sandarakinum]|uniref:hypothetical protein n=1 Tax=Streptosporangium sandarakinum TaxID=1260955 RepID=UPI003D901740
MSRAATSGGIRSSRHQVPQPAHRAPVHTPSGVDVHDTEPCGQPSEESRSVTPPSPLTVAA